MNMAATDCEFDIGVILYNRLEEMRQIFKIGKDDNIDKEICTYYKNEELSKHMIDIIKEITPKTLIDFKFR